MMLNTVGFRGLRIQTALLSTHLKYVSDNDTLNEVDPNTFGLSPNGTIPDVHRALSLYIVTG